MAETDLSSGESLWQRGTTGLAGPQVTRQSGSYLVDGRTDWAGLYRDRPERLASLALLHAGSQADAEELLQETLCHLIVRRVHADDPMAYLVRSLRNAAATRARQRGVARRAMDLRADAQRAGLGSVTTDIVPHDAMKGESIDALCNAVEQLGDAQRDVLLLKTRGGLTFAQIAIVLDMSPNTAASHYRRALEALRSKLDAEDDQHDA